MQYTVRLTPNAIMQIRDTMSYISGVLLVPETAKAWSAKLKEKISGLADFPERYPLIEQEPWHSHGIRKLQIMNFIVYYYVDSNTHTVWITATVYGKRDQLKALKNMPL